MLRHLDGLEVVLDPGRRPGAALAELQPDGGGLPEQLDGTRTLKEAAALTRLDEFEAAKVACALLFLGLVQRAPAEAPGLVAEEAPVQLADDPLFSMSEPDGPELDLGDTARESIGAPVAAPPKSSAEPIPRRRSHPLPRHPRRRWPRPLQRRRRRRPCPSP